MSQFSRVTIVFALFDAYLSCQDPLGYCAGAPNAVGGAFWQRRQLALERVPEKMPQP